MLAYSRYVAFGEGLCIAIMYDYVDADENKLIYTITQVLWE